MPLTPPGLAVRLAAPAPRRRLATRAPMLLLASALLSALVLAAPRGAPAQGVPTPAAPASRPAYVPFDPHPPKLAPIDTAALRTSMDEFMTADLAQLHVPGAVVAIVQDGRVILLRGYGVADLETKAPVDPERTIFRAGSVTKPFTATAVLQLAEQGKLDLHADVNRYLRAVRVPATFARPVTAADLLTHTAGFDVRLSGTAAPNEDGVRPLGAYLATDLPARVRPPGDTLAYSNHGYTLLGHLVEAVSGESYADYLERHVLAPLGMTSSTVRFTPDVARRAATGYLPRGAGHRAAPPVHPQIVPAASLNTTGRDMARWMIAQLEGSVDGARVLSPETLALMHAQHFAQDPRMPGMTYGYFESYWRGQRMLVHSGGIHGFMSAVYLWPEHHLGLFVADNGYRGDLVFDALFHLMRRVFPAGDTTTPAPLPGARERARRYAGSYRLANHSRTNLEKAGAIRNPPLEIGDRGDGTITAFETRFVEVAPRLFREAGGYETLAFLEDSAGAVRGVVTSYPFQGTQTWTRVGWLATELPSQLLLVLVFGAAVYTLVRPPRRREPRSLFHTPPAVPAAVLARSRRVTGIALAAAATHLLFLILMWLGVRGGGDAGMLYGVPRPMDAAALIACLGALLLLPLAWGAAWLWRARPWPTRDAVHVTTLLILGASFVALQAYWNLLGVHH